MNSRLVTERCLALGISRTDLARLTGLSWELIAHIEEHGEPPALTLDAARRLASALGIDLTTLTSRPKQPPTPNDVRLEALLAHADRPPTATDIADVFGWTLERVVDALSGLDARLAETGQTLRRLPHGRYALTCRGEVLEHDEIARLRRHESPVTGTDAALLRHLIRGRLRDRRWSEFTPDQRTSLARLAEHGLIERTSTRVNLTPDARFNLEPNLQHSGPHGVQWPLRSPALEPLLLLRSHVDRPLGLGMRLRRLSASLLRANTCGFGRPRRRRLAGTLRSLAHRPRDRHGRRGLGMRNGGLASTLAGTGWRLVRGRARCARATVPRCPVCAHRS